MRFFRSLWGSAKIVALFAWFAGELVVLRPRTRPERAEWLHRFCGTMLRSMGIRMTVEGVISGDGGFGDFEPPGVCGHYCVCGAAPVCVCVQGGNTEVASGGVDDDDGGDGVCGSRARGECAGGEGSDGESCGGGACR